QRLETFKAFAAEIDALKQKFLSAAREIKGQGRTIAGYGASATSTTLMYHFEMTDLLSYLVEDYPAKQGPYSPGGHILVMPSDALYEKKPDFVVILAWRYFEPILQKHKAYRDQGGKFIIPLPEFRIV